jgi:hypothetical protein
MSVPSSEESVPVPEFLKPIWDRILRVDLIPLRLTMLNRLIVELNKPIEDQRFPAVSSSLDSTLFFHENLRGLLG